MKRAKRYKEPEFCRVYSQKDKIRVYLPILEWTDEDVKEFIEERGIKCAPVYYDENGNFHVERRIGCMGCPLKTDHKRIEDFKKYPKLLVLYICHYQKYLSNHKGVNGDRFCGGNAYNAIFFQLFCKNANDYREKIYEGGCFRSTK